MGATLTDVAKTLCFLTDMDTFATFNEAYIGGFGDHRPARTTVGVAALPLAGAGVEIEAWAYKPACTMSDPWQPLWLGRRAAARTADGTIDPCTYHDTEWGVPQRDSRALFEFLILEGAQAGLSWSTILPSARATATRSTASTWPGSPPSPTPTSPAASPIRASCATGPRSRHHRQRPRSGWQLDDPVGLLWDFVDGRRSRTSGPRWPRCRRPPR